MADKKATIPLSQQDIPQVPDWITLPEAAKRLGIARQSAFIRAQRGYFKTLHRVGESLSVVKESEIEKILAKKTD